MISSEDNLLIFLILRGQRHLNALGTSAMKNYRKAFPGFGALAPGDGVVEIACDWSEGKTFPFK